MQTLMNARLVGMDVNKGVLMKLEGSNVHATLGIGSDQIREAVMVSFSLILFYL